MNLSLAFLAFLNDHLVQRLGWTLMHSLWQGVLIAAVLAVMLRLLKRAPANIRYVVSCSAMAMMLLAGAATYSILPDEVHDPFVSPVIDEHVERVSPIVSMPTSIATPSPRTPAAPPEAAQRDLKWIVLAWAVGVLALSLWHIGGWLLLARLRRGGQPLHAWEPALAKLRDRLHIRHAVAIIETARIDVPAVIGALRPVIVVPIGVLSGLSPQQVEAILAHELAHIRRHDYLVNLVQSAIETLLFYHPATWWISAQIRRERENCCDDIAAAVCASDRDYAAALAALEERRGGVRIAIAATGGNLIERIRRVLQLPPPTPAHSRRSRIHSLAATVLTIALVAVPLACIGASPSPSTPQPAPSAPPSVIVTQPGEYHYIKVIVGTESLSLTDKAIDWPDLKRMLADIPETERRKTVLEVAAAAPDITVERFFNVTAQLSDLVKQYGLAYLSQTGIQPTTGPAEPALPPGTESGEYYLDGDVQRSGVYSLTGRKISLKQAILAAGGLEKGLNDAYLLLIRRIDPNREEVPMQNVRVNDLLDEKVKDQFLRPNDIIRVSRKPFPPVARSATQPLILDPPPEGSNGEYYIGGDIERGGVYSVSGRMVTVRQALAAAGGLKNLAPKLTITLIRRDKNDQEHVVLDKLPVSDILEGRHPDVYVWPNDVIRVVPKDEAPSSPATLPAPTTAPTGAALPPSHSTNGLTADQIAQVDSTLREYLHLLDQYQLRFEQIKKNTRPDSPIYKDAQDDIRILQQRINAYIESLNKRPPVKPIPLAPATQPAAQPTRPS